MANISEGGNVPANDRLIGARVADAGGQQASVVSVRQDEGDDEAQVWISLDDGAQVRVPAGLLSQQADGTYRLPFAFDTAESPQPMQMRFPVMQEQLEVGKRKVDTGKGVRIHKTVSEQEKLLDEPLLREQLTVVHVPVGRVVAESDVPQMRYEGDTLIVPVLEEVLVVQKQLVLKEEVHITRQRQHVASPRTVRLRSEQVSVERFDENES